MIDSTTDRYGLKMYFLIFFFWYLQSVVVLTQLPDGNKSTTTSFDTSISPTVVSASLSSEMEITVTNYTISDSISLPNSITTDEYRTVFSELERTTVKSSSEMMASYLETSIISPSSVSYSEWHRFGNNSHTSIHSASLTHTISSFVTSSADIFDSSSLAPSNGNSDSSVISFQSSSDYVVRPSPTIQTSESMSIFDNRTVTKTHGNETSFSTRASPSIVLQTQSKTTISETSVAYITNTVSFSDLSNSSNVIGNSASSIMTQITITERSHSHTIVPQSTNTHVVSSALQLTPNGTVATSEHQQSFAHVSSIGGASATISHTSISVNKTDSSSQTTTVSSSPSLTTSAGYTADTMLQTGTQTTIAFITATTVLVKDSVLKSGVVESQITNSLVKTGETSEIHDANYSITTMTPTPFTFRTVNPTSSIQDSQKVHISTNYVTESDNPSSDIPSVSVQSIIPTLHSTYTVESTSRVIYDTGKTYSVMISFEGSCGRLENSDQLKIEFLKALIDIIQNYIPELTDDDFELSEISCDTFKVVLLIKNIRDVGCLSELSLSIRNMTIDVPIIDTTIVNYHAVGIQILTVGNDTSDGMQTKKHGLETSDIVVIVISALLFAFLIFLGGVVVCRECYKRKRAASFNLLDVPHVNLKLDDFTLTRIPRPKMTYFENRSNPIVTNGKHRQDKSNTIPKDDDGHKVQLSSDSIRVRMRDHSDGIVIGVTCSAMTNGASSPTSDLSSPCTPCMDQSEQTLLNAFSSGGGTTNPNCSVDDEITAPNETYIREDERDEIQFI